MKTAIIYHQEDMDGRMSGLLVAHAMAYHEHDFDMLGKTNANKKINLDKLMKYDQVAVTDYSLEPQVMSRLHDAGKLVWFDHHNSSMEDAIRFGYANCPGLRSLQLSATGLVFMHYDEGLSGLGPDLKELVSLVDTYDLWKNTEQRFTRATQLNYFVMSLDLDELERWLDWPENHHSLLEAIDQAVTIGKFVTKSKMSYHEVAKAHGGSIDGIPVVAYNYINSLSADMVPSDAICLMYIIQDKDTVKVSLRSKGIIDVSAIAAKFGGGGHRNAAGFTCDIATLQTFL
jgi:oligoribonuclease NrnB/cAMP/cGMP phosphodiesterase (DHH superfamily)